MRRRMSKKLVPILLSASLLAGSFAFPAETFATDLTGEIAVTETVSETEQIVPAITEAEQAAQGASEEEQSASVSTEAEQTEGQTSGTEQAAQGVSEEEQSAPVSTEAEQTAGGGFDAVRVTEESGLPYGLKGMPDGFVLSEEETAVKQDSFSHDEAWALKDLVPGKDYEENRVIFLADNEEYAKTVAQAYNAELLSFSYGVAKLKLDPEKLSVEQAVALGADPRVNLPAVTPNYIIKAEEPVPGDGITEEGSVDASFASVVPKSDHTYWSKVFDDPGLDPYYQWDDKNAYQWMHDMIGTYEAWGTTTGSPDITVAVADTGVYSEHEELKGRVTTKEVMESFSDYSGHGTHVAGIIAAKGGNGAGGVGIAPGVRILAIPIFQNSEYTNESLTKGINLAVKEGADIINMSLGGPVYSSIVHAAIKEARKAGVTIIAAMGNDGSNCVYYPAGYPEVISVVAVDESGSRTDFSTYGPWADIGAPGQDILSSWNGHNKAEADANKNESSTYAVWEGTSMASPVVAGACALYMSAVGHHVDPDTMEKVLKAKATKTDDPNMGVGIVNVAAMIPCSTDAPVISASGGSLTALSASSEIHLSAKAYAAHSFGYVYTVNGKDPAIKDGAVTRGYFSENGVISVASLLADKAVVTGETITFKAAAVTAKGKLGKIRKVSIQITGDSKAMSIQGPGFIAKGKTGSYKALYETAALKKAGTIWSLAESVTGVSVNEKTGKVTVKKNCEAASVTLQAASRSDNTIIKTVEIGIVAPAASVTVTAPAFDQNINQPSYNKNGALTGIRVYNVDLSSTELSENTIRLQGKTAGNISCPVFTSSNAGIASVEEISAGDGTTVVLITGHKAGKAKITCKAGDGSGKTAAVTVQVIVPASGLTILQSKEQHILGYGKSMRFKAALGTAYGKPSVKKVTWAITRIKAYDLDDFLNGADIPGEDNGLSVSSGRISDFVTIDQKGKLTVKKKLKDEGHDFYGVAVSATTADGTALTDTWNVYIQAPATYMETGMADEDDNYKKTNGRFTVKLDSTKNGMATICVKSDFADSFSAAMGFVPDLIVQSSNPQVASIFHNEHNSIKDGAGYHAMLVRCYKKGTAVLTLKANDGSGKKATYYVTVK